MADYKKEFDRLLDDLNLRARDAEAVERVHKLANIKGVTVEQIRDTYRKATFPAKTYKAKSPDLSLRAFLPEVQEASKSKRASLVDVRSPQEFTGEILAPPGLPETCQRGGHIPGAKSIPWAKACNDDGTFKSFDELKALYGAQGVTADKPVIAYCRIGERSSHTWFVLKYLLRFQNVKNYDGSTREEAEQRAIEKATKCLAQTRRFPTA